MRLPFSKNPKIAADGSIEVKAVEAVKKVPKGSAPIPKAIANRVLPDLGDYEEEYPEALPESARILPFLGWGLCILVAVAFTWGSMEDSKIRKEKSQSDLRLKAAQGQTAALANKLGGLFAKESDLIVLTKWVSINHPLRGAVMATLSSAADKVQIRSFEIKRRDPAILRYAIQISCLGTRGNFDAMRQELIAKLEGDGWTVTESQGDPEDARLLFDATITRK